MRLCDFNEKNEIEITVQFVSIRCIFWFKKLLIYKGAFLFTKFVKKNNGT